MEKLYGEDNKLPLSNISFNSSSRDYKMPKSGESLPDILRMQLILINYLSTCFFICLFLSLFFWPLFIYMKSSNTGLVFAKFRIQEIVS